MEYKELMEKFAFKEGVIHTIDDLKEKITLEHGDLENNRISEDMWWKKDFKGTFEEDTKHIGFHNVMLNGKRLGCVYRLNDLMKLKERVLAFGGNNICLDSYEEDLDNLLNRGQLWIYKKNRRNKVKGAISQCHKNSSELWHRNHKDIELHICTGYALTKKDGLWRQHSWLVYLKDGAPKIIETTVDWVAYYGFVMTDEECLEFFSNNC